MKKILLILAVAVAGFLFYVSKQPSSYEVSRTLAINAPAKKIFPLINTRKIANSWNPFIQQDPTAKLTLSGPETGVGSKTSWVGGKDLGEGSATVIESVPNQRVVVKLEYLKPFTMTQEAAFVLEPAGKQTNVTWKVYGHKKFLNRVVCTFMNMDKMVGDVFMKGLESLKALAEK